MDHAGERFLHSQDSNLQQSLAVELEQIRREQTGEEPETKPAEKIADWMEVLERTHMGHNDDPRVKERIKDSYHKRYVIKPDQVPESAFELEVRIAREQGHGDIPITDEFRERKTAEIISNQSGSLDRWVDYLTSPDAQYPTWAKYWAFTSMVKMGKFEKTIYESGQETARFAKRTDDTVAPFPQLNPRALAQSIGAIEAKVAQKGLPKAVRTGITNTSTQLDDPEFAQLVSSESFPKLYAQFLTEIPAYSTEGLQETRGRWVKYDQGSDATPLVGSLVGHPLEWCTADLATASTQLEGGDFHVYYSLDEDFQATIPRVAIRMEEDAIVEVRGIAPDQNIDPYITEVVSEKMGEFPDGEAYAKKSADMAKVTEIEERTTAGEPLTTADLRFLYEIDGTIEGFGYERDPRIAALLEGRDLKEDIASVFGVPVSQIGTKAEDVLVSTEALTYYHGDLDLDSLTSPVDVVLPERVGGALYIRNLTASAGLVLPEHVGGDLDLRKLPAAAGLKFPQILDHDLVLSGLTTAEGLVLPQHIGGELYLDGITSPEGLVLPQSLDCGVSLDSLVTAEGLVLPPKMHGVSLNALTCAQGLVLPRDVGFIMLGGLTSAKGLELPPRMAGTLALHGLTSAEGLVLPQYVGGFLYLHGLTSAAGLVLPEHIGDFLTLDGLTSAEGLVLPQSIGGYVHANKLGDDDKNMLKSQYPKLRFYEDR